MNTYNFYYDESSHSRNINEKTFYAHNYYENFIATIIGWDSNKNELMASRFERFSNMYKNDYCKDGEFKSQTIKAKNFEFGFASLNKHVTQFLHDYFSLFDSDINIYVCCISKFEYIINQLLCQYPRNNLINAIEYTIVKTILVYKPKELINAILNQDYNSFIKLLKYFLMQQYKNNKKIPHKNNENKNILSVIHFLNYIKPYTKISHTWNYKIALDGFKLYLKEKQIIDYHLFIDNEINTKESAMAVLKTENISNCDSKQYYQIQLADLMSGILLKLLSSINNERKYKNSDSYHSLQYFNEKWFELNKPSFLLYQKLYDILFVYDNSYTKVYTGIYRDDLNVLKSLLMYFHSYSYEEYYEVYKKRGAKYHSKEFMKTLNQVFREDFDITIN